MATPSHRLQSELMKDERPKVAAALLFGVLSTLGVGHTTAATSASSEVRYACQPGEELLVTRSGKAATVHVINRTYQLRRKASSIGEKYISSSAALIIDGKSAVFVAEDRLQFGTCVEATQLAAR